MSGTDLGSEKRAVGEKKEPKNKTKILALM